ncbi:hypothetical protein A8F94_24495 [Bacillus sp. FJAT-27225]|nr:hypothetical protein A8F94_24495 [Bacillus sp. FJAT-27225]
MFILHPESKIETKIKPIVNAFFNVFIPFSNSLNPTTSKTQHFEYYTKHLHIELTCPVCLMRNSTKRGGNPSWINAPYWNKSGIM